MSCEGRLSSPTGLPHRHRRSRPRSMRVRAQSVLRLVALASATERAIASPPASFEWALMAGMDESNRGNGIASGGSGDVFVTGVWNDGGESSDIFVMRMHDSGLIYWATFVGQNHDRRRRQDQGQGGLQQGETLTSHYTSGGCLTVFHRKYQGHLASQPGSCMAAGGTQNSPRPHTAPLMGLWHSGLAATTFLQQWCPLPVLTAHL